MTKLNWAKIVIFFFVFVFLIFSCVLEDRMVVHALENVRDYCYRIEKATETNGGIVNGQVASLVDNLDYSWSRDEEKLCYLVDHKSMEQLGIEIVRLKTYIDEEEPIEFFTSLEIIKNYVETFQHFMGSSYKNFL